MKTLNLHGGLILLAGLLLSAGTHAATSGPPLPGDSVYQLPVVLIDQSGEAFDWRNRRGAPQVVTMFYTSCPYMCPLIVDTGKAIEKALTPDEREGLHVLFISMDPGKDTPAALMDLVNKRQLDTDRWTLASPQEQSVPSVAGVLGVRYRKLASGDFNHTGELILLDREGRIVARTDKLGISADPEFLASVRQVINASSQTLEPQPKKEPR